MKYRLILFLLLTAATAAANNSSGLVPIEDFARAPLYTRVQLSPDGRTIAFFREADGRPSLLFADLATMESHRLKASDVPYLDVPEEVSSFRWIGDRRIVFWSSVWDEYWTGVSAVDCDGLHWKALSGVDANGRNPLLASEVIFAFDDANQEILMLDRKKNYGLDRLYPDVLRVDTLAGTHRRIVTNPGNVTGWGVDHSGVVRWGVTRNGTRNGMIYRANADDPWRVVPIDQDSRELQPLGFDSSNQKLYVAALSPQRRWAIYLFDPTSGKLGNLILDDPQYDVLPDESFKSIVNRAVFAGKQHRLAGIYYVTDGPRCRWFEPNLIRYQAILDHSLPKTINLIAGMTRDERHFLVFSFSDRDPGSYYIFDVGHLTLIRLAARMPWIKPEQMADIYPIQYKARDGRLIHGYLTLPNGHAPKNLPLVVMPHGGPFFRDMWDFDPLPQMIANRGYAVLQMNYRGSPGYGYDFSRSGRHEIGRKIQDDIEDGTRWAISHGIADRRRVAIVGASYGGYSALFALANSPDMYRCGISIAGVTDWLGIINGQSSDEYEIARPYWLEHFGDPITDSDLLRSISPVNFADKIKAPLLIIQGTYDRTVPQKQARVMIAALEKAGRPPQSLFLPGEGHNFNGEEGRIAMFKRIDGFLAENLGP